MITLIIFWRSIEVYFVQDDFYLLTISQSKSLLDFSSFIIPRSDVVWYRPLSSQVFFFISKSLFNLNPYSFRVIVFLTHALAGYLVFLFAKKILVDRKLAIFAAFIYVSHQIHVISISWLAAYSFILGPFCILGVLYFYSEKRFIKAFLCCALALLTNEVSLIIVPCLFFYQILIEGKVTISKLTPYIILCISIIFLRLILFPSLVSDSQYIFTLNLQAFSLVKFYMLRLLGFPMAIEAMPFIQKVAAYVLAGIFSMIIFLGSVIAFKQSLQKEKKVILFLGSLIIAGLLPFIFLLDHIAPHYLSFSLLGASVFFAYSIGKLIKQSKHHFLLITVSVFLYTIIQLVGSQWTYNSHWIFSRAELAKKLITEKKFTHAVGTEEYFSLGANTAVEFFDE